MYSLCKSLQDPTRGPNMRPFSAVHPIGGVRRAVWILALAATLVQAAACSGDEPTTMTTPDATTPPPTPPAVAAAPTSIPTVAPTAAPAPTSAPADASAGQTQTTVTVAGGTVARYMVGEQLARRTLPNDAIGETPDVEGTIVFTPDGDVDQEQSKITIGLAGLTSDEDRRDRYVRDRLFDTSKFPNAELTVTGVPGLPWPLPDSGQATFQITGDLTLRDVSRPVTWDATVQIDGGSVTGQATTVVTFDQFEMSKPSFGFIISVEDEIRLELDITATVDKG